MANFDISLSEIDLRQLMLHQQDQAQQDLLAQRSGAVVSWMCIHLMLDAGLAPIQVARLRLEDVELLTGTLRVRPASENRGRTKTVILSRALQEHLRQFVAWKQSTGQSTEDWDVLILGKRGPLTSAGIQQSFKQAVRRAGLDSSINIQQVMRLLPKSDRPERRTIALMVPAAEPTAAFSPLIYEAWRSVETYFNDLGFDVVVGQSHPDRLVLPGKLSDQTVDGLILIASQIAPQTLAQWSHVPAVWLFTPMDHWQIWGDLAAPDNRKIGRLVAEYLHRQGHRRTCYVSLENVWGFHHGGLTMRRSTFKQSIEAMGGCCHVIKQADVPAEQLDSTSVLDQAWLEQQLDQVLALPDSPTGWFISHSREYQFVYNYLKRRGIDPKRDIELVVCDNVPIIRELENPPIAVDVCAKEMGRQGAELLLRRISGQASAHNHVILIQPKLMRGTQPVNL